MGGFVQKSFYGETKPPKNGRCMEGVWEASIGFGRVLDGKIPGMSALHKFGSLPIVNLPIDSQLPSIDSLVQCGWKLHGWSMAAIIACLGQSYILAQLERSNRKQWMEL